MNTILIVDDSPTDAYLAQKCAANLFTEVRTAHNVDCAFQELDAFQPSVILMDWTLDDLKNGISRQLRPVLSFRVAPRTPTVPILPSRRTS